MYLVGLGVHAPRLRLLAKGVPVLCLAGLVLRDHPDSFGRMIAGGLVLSAAGDLLLEAAPRFFIHGLAAFLLAHLAYLGAFTKDVPRLAPLRLLPFAAFGVTTFAVLRPGLWTMATPVACYVTTIVAMMWRAAARVGASPRGAASAWLALAGAVAFALSDTLIAFDRFFRPLPAAGYPIILLYWAGQLGIARSALPSGSD